MSDPLSEILRLTEARSVIAGGIAAGGRWAMVFPPPGGIKFAALAKGTLLMRIAGQKKVVRAEAGDAMLLPGQRGFIVGTDLDAPPRDAIRFMEE